MGQQLSRKFDESLTMRWIVKSDKQSLVRVLMTYDAPGRKGGTRRIAMQVPPPPIQVERARQAAEMI